MLMTLLFMLLPKNFSDIENALTSDLKAMDQYLRENELIINLNKGKTEVMLFGTHKKRGNKQLMYRTETSRSMKPLPTNI